MEQAPNSAAITEDFEFSALREAHYYPRAIVREFRPYLQGHVVEVGSGIGQMANLFTQEPRVETFTAVEPDECFALEFRRQCPEVTLVEGTVSELVCEGGCDAILSINVIEHISDHLDELKRYKKLLEPRGGYVCILTPARPEIYSPIDSDFGHFRRYTKKSLSDLLTTAGFKTEKVFYFNFPGYFVWWLNFKILKSRSFNPLMVRLYDRLIFRFFSKIETNLIRPPLGQSVIAIGKA